MIKNFEHTVYKDSDNCDAGYFTCEDVQYVWSVYNNVMSITDLGGYEVEVAEDAVDSLVAKLEQLNIITND